jgi:peptidoglycan glycosyltransferase
VTINRAISRLIAIFVIAYMILFARQLYVQVIEGPRLATNAHNPRAQLLAPFRGAIVARDGTVLARSTAKGRSYPLGAALAHAVGYDSPRYGTFGLESAYDEELSAHAVTNDPLAEILGALGGKRGPAIIHGATIVTTLDPVVQSALYDALAQHARGAGVAIDPRTGEILALASVPAFDPNELDASFATLVKDTESPLLDRATDGLYPPGSTFKIVTAAAGLEAGVISMDSTFEDSGALPVGTFVVHDNEGEATGSQDLTGAFALSSNVDFAQIALKLGPDGWLDETSRWGFGESTDFALPVSADRLPAKAELSPGVLAQLGFGQADLLVTPLRMALVAATIAANGLEPRPILVSAIREDGHDRKIAVPAAIATPMSNDTAADLNRMMVAVVQHGTGTAAALPDVSVAGKTGTATNPAGRSHAWFVAFAPADAPRVAVAIVVENAGYGGDVAAPIARRVIAAALSRPRE